MDIRISAPKSINATIKLPPSKSISNRMLLINELSGNRIKLDNVSDCDDTFVMERALRERSKTTDIMAAGTSMRFLTAYFSASPSCTVMTGTHRMLQRPISILVEALRSLGANIEYVGEDGYPPLRIVGRKLEGGEICLPGNVSSQYISALLMIAPLMSKGLVLRIEGDIISRPYIGITIKLMRQFGIEVEQPDDATIIVHSGEYNGGDYSIENDWSAASYWYEMLALASSGEIRLEGLYEHSMQGDACVSRLFEPLGIRTAFDGNVAVLSKSESAMDFYEADLTMCPDLAQTMVATCCAMGKKFCFSGLQSLKIKETDRINALIKELGKMGFVLHEQSEGVLLWDGARQPRQEPVKVDTYEDHRMAMCMAPCATVCGELIVRNAQVVSKSYSAYWRDLSSVGYKIEKL